MSRSASRSATNSKRYEASLGDAARVGTQTGGHRYELMQAPKIPTPDADDPEILDTGQEEVFSRTEVELGEIEHGSDAGSHAPVENLPPDEFVACPRGVIQ